jgi:hypothetical protein
VYVPYDVTAAQSLRDHVIPLVVLDCSKPRAANLSGSVENLKCTISSIVKAAPTNKGLCMRSSISFTLGDHLSHDHFWRCVLRVQTIATIIAYLTFFVNRLLVKIHRRNNALFVPLPVLAPCSGPIGGYSVPAGGKSKWTVIFVLVVLFASLCLGRVV